MAPPQISPWDVQNTKRAKVLLFEKHGNRDNDSDDHDDWTFVGLNAVNDFHFKFYKQFRENENLFKN